LNSFIRLAQHGSLEAIVMSIRTTQSVVHFSSEFVMHGLDAPQPAGDYELDHDEELIEGLSWLGYRRVATFIHLPAIAAKTQIRQVMQIDPADLEVALRKDREPQHPFGPPSV
jgi:hypothetical protein